jgi:hypothetical protein
LRYASSLRKCAARSTSATASGSFNDLFGIITARPY